MTLRLRHAVAAAAILALVLTGTASAAPTTKTYRFGPIKVGPYQVKQNDYDLGIPKPAEDGYITGMEVDIVDSNGSQGADQPADAPPHRVRQHRARIGQQARPHLRPVHAAGLAHADPGLGRAVLRGR